MSENHFQANIIKGRIAETVFELMFREEKKFDIYPLGYEHTTPILRQYRDHPNQQHKDILNDIIANFSSSPDFLLTNSEKSEIYLVEVKYRSIFKPREILDIVTEINNRWTHAHLFLATPQGFYYDSCQTIINNNGQISSLNKKLISSDKQTFYYNLLMRFEK